MPLYYIHAPKCGGTFVEKTLSPFIKKSPTLTLPDARGHLTWMQYRDVFRKHGIDIFEATTFSVVRNPWDWHVSWFHYIKNDKGGRRSGHAVEHRLFQDFAFRDYIHWLEDPAAERGPQGYLVRQLSDWVIDESEQVAVDHVLRQERLQDELAALVEKLNLDVQVTPMRVNSSKRGHYQGYYDAETRGLIARRHARDLKLFGYEF